MKLLSRFAFPAVSNGCVYVRSTLEAACWDWKPAL